MRAILTLPVPVAPDQLRRSADRTALRADLARAGAAVGAGLRGTPYTVHRRYGTVPYLAVTVAMSSRGTAWAWTR